MKILMVDDDAEDRDILQFSMESVNATDTVCFAENGEQALTLLNNHYPLTNIPMLIILDLNMPRMNGTETLRNLKSDERFKNIPVIIYSTSINPFEKEKCMELGAHSFITKPISYQESLENASIFLRFL
ncbi:response regulator [Chitinophaga sp. 22321]|uniref:Response regulator n=1 Tax=Chitinophaga hostae TaxID=2831022 RepID=A0ABS5J7B6_9BACT|nr:response regulator [Chitinophaga hostae]MBS0031111.1 response regulator [Chitinophaga hostae]